MTILHTTHTGEGNIEDVTTTQHHLAHYIQTVISETFSTRGQLGQVNGFISTINITTAQMSFTHVTLMEITNKFHQCQAYNF